MMAAARVGVVKFTLPLLQAATPHICHQAAVVLAVTVVLAALVQEVQQALAAHILNLQQDRAAPVVVALVCRPALLLLITAAVVAVA
jgi:hypothetical protein